MLVSWQTALEPQGEGLQGSVASVTVDTETDAVVVTVVVVVDVVVKVVVAVIVDAEVIDLV